VQIEGERRFGAPPDAVYRALTDPDELAAAFPAIERIEAAADEWTVVARPGIGGLRLKISVRLEEERPPEHARLRAWGKSLGGRLSVDSSFELTPDGEGARMRWQAEVTAAGLLSALGSQGLAGAATHQADRALAKLDERLVSKAR
jgi:carbon monoxide dehydrogenase subunit G